jgi:hypothetical protein
MSRKARAVNRALLLEGGLYAKSFIFVHSGRVEQLLYTGWKNEACHERESGGEGEFSSIGGDEG